MKCAYALLTLALLNIHLHCRTYAEVLRIEDYPFLVCLADTRKVGPIGYCYCGGAIVGRTLVITAASCFENLGILQRVIDTGVIRVHSNTNKPYQCYMEHLVIKLYRHEKFDRAGSDYDIALVKVKEEFLNKYEKPAKLPGKNFEYRIGSTAQFIAWSNRAGVTDYFESAEVQLVDTGICYEQQDNKPINLTSRMICGMNKITDAHRGKLRANVLYQNGYLIGILIMSNKAGSNLYTKVSEDDEWIRSRLKEKDSTTQSVQLTAKEC